MHQTFSYTDSSFYTTDHEWVMFEGIVAYMGICPFKLTGINKIDRIEFADLSAKLEKGSCLATIHSDDYQIKVHMPVEGWVIESNIRSAEDPSYIRQDIRSGWIAKIRPVAPYSREGLLRAEEYKLRIKKKVRA